MSEKKYTIDEVLLTFHSWQAMKARCSDKCNHRTDRKHYVERGVKIYDEWKNDFKIFMRDLGPRPGAEYTLDRFPNKNGNYEPANVRWATKTEQAVNRKSTRFITYNGETLSISEWSKKFNIGHGVISRRLDDNWSPEKIFNTPVATFSPITRSFASGRTSGKKLQLFQVNEIVEKAKTGKFIVRDLVEEYHVSKGCIYKLLKQFNVPSKLGRKKNGI